MSPVEENAMLRRIVIEQLLEIQCLKQQQTAPAPVVIEQDRYVPIRQVPYQAKPKKPHKKHREKQTWEHWGPNSIHRDHLRRAVFAHCDWGALRELKNLPVTSKIYKVSELLSIAKELGIDVDKVTLDADVATYARGKVMPSDPKRARLLREHLKTAQSPKLDLDVMLRQ